MSAQHVVDIGRAREARKRSAFLVSPEEMDALHGAGPLACWVYVCLRSWMDFETGLVGLTRALSREMLCTYAETHTPRGSGTQVSRPSLKEIRGAIEALVRHHLLVRKGGDLLVFSMPMARTGNVRSLQTGPSEGRIQGRPLASVGAGLRGGEVVDNLPYRANNRESDCLSTQQAAVVHVPEVAATQPDAAAAASNDELTEAKPPMREPTQQELERDARQVQVDELEDVLTKHDIRFTAPDKRIDSWVVRGIEAKHVLAAIGKAKARRAKEQSTQAIWIGFIDLLLNSDIKPARKPKASSTAAGEKQPSGSQGWRSDSASIRRKARELGMTEQLVADGNKQRMETIHELAERVAQRLQEGGA